MTEEMFDIVDVNNQLTGRQKPRSLVHKENEDWHRVAAIWIVNDKHQILCQLRSRKKDKDPGVWQANFGGHLKAGQTYAENAVEELKEEIGLAVSASSLVTLHVSINPIHKHFAQVFVLPWDGRLTDLNFLTTRWSKLNGSRWKGWKRRFEPVNSSVK